MNNASLVINIILSLGYCFQFITEMRSQGYSLIKVTGRGGGGGGSDTNIFM